MKVNLVTLAHDFARERLRPGDWAIDATAGNGHDTLFLAREVGVLGRVAAFDIQAAAVEATRSRLSEFCPEVSADVYLCGHEKMSEVLGSAWRGNTKAVFFNLGYLPKSDHGITTQSETTLTALNAAWELLDVGGFISLTIYTRHPGGFEESRSVNTWIDSMTDIAEIHRHGEHNPLEPWWVSLGKTK